MKCCGGADIGHKVVGDMQHEIGVVGGEDVNASVFCTRPHDDCLYLSAAILRTEGTRITSKRLHPSNDRHRWAAEKKGKRQIRCIVFAV